MPSRAVTHQASTPRRTVTARAHTPVLPRVKALVQQIPAGRPGNQVIKRFITSQNYQKMFGRAARETISCECMKQEPTRSAKSLRLAHTDCVEVGTHGLCVLASTQRIPPVPTTKPIWTIGTSIHACIHTRMHAYYIYIYIYICIYISAFRRIDSIQSARHRIAASRPGVAAILCAASSPPPAGPSPASRTTEPGQCRLSIEREL
jgi:hypothetical protein